VNETPKTTHWPSFLRELNATEQAWRQYEVRYSREDAVPWMPFPMPLFVTLLTDAVEVAPPSRPRGPAVTGWGRELKAPRFLDVGCGPGTKVRLASALFGVDGYGIDIVPRFVAEAQAHGVQAWLQDAFEFPEGDPRNIQAGALMPGYADFQIVYVNRPSALQDDLENLVMERMAPDAVLIAVNWRNNPGKAGWIPVSEEFGEPVRGVWVKP
jgi:SAM-dependent methyltransferase